MVRIKAVEAKNDYTLLLTFTNDKTGIFDAKPYLEGGIFEALKDPALFKSVRVVHGTIEWANGADLCPDCVYLDTKFFD